jgi:hypothetical protein
VNNSNSGPDHVPYPADESKLLTAAEALVQNLIKADRKRKWQVRVLGVVSVLLIVVSVFTALGYFSNRDAAAGIKNNARGAVAYTNTVVQHECQALELLTRTPVPKPSDPAANPSREVSYKTYEALVFWKHSDGCK